MRKLNLLFVFFLLIGLGTSCSSDDSASNNNINSGKLIVNGVERPLLKGYLRPNYTGNNVNYDKRRFYLILTNGDVAMENNDLVHSDNITQLIDFNMYCSIEHPGSVEYTTYNVFNSHTDTDFNDAFIDHSGINTNVVLQNGEYISGDSLSSDDMTNGQAGISYSNGIYTINFSFSNAENTVTGTYTGTLTELNYQY